MVGDRVIGQSKVPSVNDWVVNGERGESARVKITLPTDFNRLLVSTTIDRVLELTQLGATLRARCECSTDRLYVCWGRGHNTMEGVGTRSQSESKNHIPTVFNRLLVSEQQSIVPSNALLFEGPACCR